LDYPDFWGVAGYPISHSLTPRLFEIVGGVLDSGSVKTVFLEARDADEFFERAEKLEGELWISCTSPLKNSVWKALGFEDEDGLQAVNQLVRKDGEWEVYNSDGRGFIMASRHIGLEPSGSILRIRGGGSTARSIAHSWSKEGGHIIPVRGRRALTRGPWDVSIVDDSLEADISVDLDAEAGGGESFPLPAGRQVSISYGEDWEVGDFAMTMVVAQHLEAWGMLFAPDMIDGLPSIDKLLELLGEVN
tara:strand:+ start:1001 stop:1741 length:741 start_codon:yes stop_codon:yes gene_type:complete